MLNILLLLAFGAQEPQGTYSEPVGPKATYSEAPGPTRVVSPPGMAVPPKAPVRASKAPAPVVHPALALGAPVAPAPLDSRKSELGDAEVVQGDARMIPRITRRGRGSYETVWDPRVVLPLWTKMRYQTMITLPSGEAILKANAADDSIWEVLYDKGGNTVRVKPSFDGGTNIFVRTKSGRVYIFEATSDSERRGGEYMAIFDVLPPAWLRSELETRPLEAGAPAAPHASGPRNGSEDDDSRAMIAAAYQKGLETGSKEERANRDDELREYAVSFMKNQNSNYAWSRGTGKIRIRRVFDDGEKTCVVFETAMNQYPLIQEVVDGEARPVNAMPATFDPNIMIVGKLFKEAIVSVDKDQLKITNRAWSLKDKDKAEYKLQAGNQDAQPVKE